MNRYYILIIRHGKAHIVKGPFAFNYVSAMLQTVRNMQPDAILSVCEIVNGDTLWATSEKEWLIINKAK